MNMMWRLLFPCVYGLWLCVTPAGSAIADAEHPDQHAYYPEVTTPRTAQFDIRSVRGNRDYRIFVALPTGPAPAGGYPVLYILDGNAHFSTAVFAARLTGLGSSVIVGIGYQINNPLDYKARRYDLTPPSADGWQPPAQSAGPPGTVYGGQDEFLDFIQHELEPRIERQFGIDRTRQALFGHSLGGLFVLHVLFTMPDAFQTYIAASPSIWWNEGSILNEERAFESGQCGSKVRPVVLVTVGSLERMAAPDSTATASSSPATQAIGQAQTPRALAGHLATLTSAESMLPTRSFPTRSMLRCLQRCSAGRFSWP